MDPSSLFYGEGNRDLCVANPGAAAEWLTREPRMRGAEPDDQDRPSRTRMARCRRSIRSCEICAIFEPIPARKMPQGVDKAIF